MSKDYKNKITDILKSSEIGLFDKPYDFNGARRAIFSSSSLLALMKKNGVTKTYEISSGVSDKKAFTPYIKQAVTDMMDATYYRNYFVNKGEETSRSALAYYENGKFGNDVYKSADFCLTEGSTGAISAIIESFARKYPKSEVLITNPCYYLYKSACKYYGITYKEVSLFGNMKTGTMNFTSIFPLMQAINKKTKLIILNNPFNPSGEIYLKDDLMRLFRKAKETNTYVLVDELFQDLVFNPSQFTCSDLIAEQEKMLDSLIVVKGYSKNKNLVALRMGYVFSKNREIIENVARINQVRQSFPTASNYAGLIALDAFIQSVLYINERENSLMVSIKQVRTTFPSTEAVNEKTDQELLTLTKMYKKYFFQLMKDYSQSYDRCCFLLENITPYCLPKMSAFNTFFRIPTLDKVNMFDFTLNLYVYTGVKIEIGPCFGFTQMDWQTNPNLGFWLRITFAKDREILEEGINKFISFSREYKTNTKKWIKTDLEY